MPQTKYEELTTEKGALAGMVRETLDIGDKVGAYQIQSRITEIDEELAALSDKPGEGDKARVVISFGGAPVFGARGIRSDFAGTMISLFQRLVSKVYINELAGQMASRGRIPLKEESGLFLSGVAHGSFGFVLEEVAGESGVLKNVTVKATQLLQLAVNENVAMFETMLDEIDNRTLSELKDIFRCLDENNATCLIDDSVQTLTLDKPAVARGKNRTESIVIEENETEIKGRLVGVLPVKKWFEIVSDEGELISGKIAAETQETYFPLEGSKLKLNYSGIFRCAQRVLIQPGKLPRKIYTLIDVKEK